jgi:hypothetical protein
MSDTPQIVACPSCGRQFVWKPDLAGHKGQCKCGVVFRFPQQAGQPATAIAPANAKPAAAPGPKSAGPALAKAAPAVPGSKRAPVAKSGPAGAKAAGKTPEPAVAGSGAQLHLDRTGDVETYDLATDENVCPSCLGVMKPEQVVCITCGYNRKTGKKMPQVKIVAEEAPGGLMGFFRGLFGGAKNKPQKQAKA